MSPNSTRSVLVMVPTQNEKSGLRRVLQDVPEDLDVLVVNGGNIDETVDVAKQYRAIVTRQKFGRGNPARAYKGLIKPK